MLNYLSIVDHQLGIRVHHHIFNTEYPYS